MKVNDLINLKVYKIVDSKGVSTKSHEDFIFKVFSNLIFLLEPIAWAIKFFKKICRYTENLMHDAININVNIGVLTEIVFRIKIRISVFAINPIDGGIPDIAIIVPISSFFSKVFIFCMIMVDAWFCLSIMFNGKIIIEYRDKYRIVNSLKDLTTMSIHLL